MSNFSNTVVLTLLHGHCSDIFVEAINIAKLLDKNVEFIYNGVKITLNKNSTPESFDEQFFNGLNVKD